MEARPVGRGRALPQRRSIPAFRREGPGATRLRKPPPQLDRRTLHWPLLRLPLGPYPEEGNLLNQGKQRPPAPVYAPLQRRSHTALKDPTQVARGMRGKEETQVCASTVCACAKTPARSLVSAFATALRPAPFLPPRCDTSQRVTCKANNHSPSPREPVGEGEGGEGGGKRTKGAGCGDWLVPVTQSESSGEERGGAQKEGGGARERT